MSKEVEIEDGFSKQWLSETHYTNRAVLFLREKAIEDFKQQLIKRIEEEIEKIMKEHMECFEGGGKDLNVQKVRDLSLMKFMLERVIELIKQQ
jgi:hypothetical protein